MTLVHYLIIGNDNGVFHIGLAWSRKWGKEGRD
jgi:hypothetical protein